MTSTPSPRPSPGDLRVSDADRDLVTEVLNSAYAEGRITHDELGERMDAVLASRTFSDLTPLTADLMSSRLTTQYSSPRPVASRPDGAEGVVVVDARDADPSTDTITAILATRKREVGWHMRRRTTAVAVMGDVVLDLRNGVMESESCELNVTVFLGDVKLYVPDGVAIVDKTVGMLTDTTMKGLRPVPVGSPTVTLTGFVLLGDVKVLGPDHRSLGQRLGLS